MGKGPKSKAEDVLKRVEGVLMRKKYSKGKRTIKKRIGGPRYGKTNTG